MKVKNLRERNFEDEKQMEKEDTQRRNLKIKYLSLTVSWFFIVLNIAIRSPSKHFWSI